MIFISQSRKICLKPENFQKFTSSLNDSIYKPISFAHRIRHEHEFQFFQLKAWTKFSK